MFKQYQRVGKTNEKNWDRKKREINKGDYGNTT